MTASCKRPLKRTSIRMDEASIQYGGGKPSFMHNTDRHPLHDNTTGGLKKTEIRLSLILIQVNNKETKSKEIWLICLDYVILPIQFSSLGKQVPVLSFLEALEGSVSKSEESIQDDQDLRSQSSNNHGCIDESQ